VCSSDLINSVMKKAFNAVGYSGESMVTQISSALATIGQNIGELRNDIGITAHGMSLEELRARNDKVDALTREFLVDATVITACFLIRSFETKHPRSKAEVVEVLPLYSEFEDFNDYWDDLYGEFEMGGYSFTASEVLFSVDNKAYMTEQQAFAEGEDGTDH
jgi:hypothetical protein